MAFRFNWTQFDDAFMQSAKQQLEMALNRGQKAPHICDDIVVKELEFGTVAPELEILEIGELSSGRFRGMFRLNYSGNALLILQTHVQVNPVTQSRAHAHTPVSMGSYLTSPYNTGIQAAETPLVMPMQLVLQKLKLNAIISLSYSATQGLTLNFKNDPLRSVEVTSTFDQMASVREMLASEIEGRLRSTLRDVIPRVLHEMSLERMRTGPASPVVASMPNLGGSASGAFAGRVASVPPAPVSSREFHSAPQLSGDGNHVRASSVPLSRNVRELARERVAVATAATTEVPRSAPPTRPTPAAPPRPPASEIMRPNVTRHHHHLLGFDTLSLDRYIPPPSVRGGSRSMPNSPHKRKPVSARSNRPGRIITRHDLLSPPPKSP